MANGLKWTISFHRLDLKYTWAIARNSTDYKINAFVTVSDGLNTGTGEAAPNVRYAESPELFEKIFPTLNLAEFENLPDLSTTLKEQQVPNSLRFAIESAYVHFVCASSGQHISSYFGLEKPGIRDTSYTIPIMPTDKLEDYFKQYQPQRFKYIKLKVNGDNLVEYVKEVRKLCQNPFMIDANEAYTNPDILLSDLRKTNEHNIEFIEQPFPSGNKDEYLYLKTNAPFPIFADESVTDNADFSTLGQCFHGINVKLMKAGGYANGIHLLSEAKKHGLKTMIGCMVETGLGISSGLALASFADYLDLDSFLILKEDIFPLVGEKEGKLFLANSH